MSMQPSLAAYIGAALLASPLQALANSDSWHDRHAREYRWERHDDRHSSGPEKRLVEKYDRFAGSDRNARELVEGLRNDSEIDLSKGGKTTSFKPATDKMGYGNVDIALGLAKASLAEHGIHNPTPDQIKAALNGGTVTTKSGQRVTLPGVLKLRASGMGWGQVAHKVGVDKKNDDRHHHKHAKHHDRDDDDDRHHHRKHAKHEYKHDWKHDKHHDRDHGDRPDHRKQAHHQKPDWKHQRQEHQHEQVKHHQHRPEFHRAKFERPDRVHRPEKVERPHRPERPERPERHHHRR